MRETINHFLVIKDLKGKRKLLLESATYSLGRDPRNSIVIHAPSISRQHATILRATASGDNGCTFRVVDGNLNGKRSTNGLFVNGNRCFSHDLKNGDVIEFANQAKAQYLAIVKKLDQKQPNSSTKNSSDSNNSPQFNPYQTIVADNSSNKSDENASINVASLTAKLRSSGQSQLQSSSPNLDHYQTLVDSRDSIKPDQDAARSSQSTPSYAIRQPEIKLDGWLNALANRANTSTNSILNTTEQLLNSELTPQQQSYVQTVRSQNEKLLNTINQLLDLAKIESGKLNLEKYPFELRQWLDGCLEPLNTQANAQNLKLDYSIDDAVPDAIVADANRLQQILTNLIDNALNFTDSGAIKLSITAQLIESSASIYRLHFSIKDTGIGIAGIRSDLFEFQPTAASPCTGLATSKKLSEMMQGKIWGESQGRVYGTPPLNWQTSSSLGVGSTFHFTVLAQAEATAIPKLSLANGSSIPNGLSSPKILMVEDCKVNQQVTMLTLQSLGYQADIVNSGKEAVEAWHQTSYDIVLMDLEMPQMDGLSATFHLRQQTLSSHYPYIIATTASTDPDTEQKCLQAGMNVYLAKPFTKTELQRVLQQAQTHLSAIASLDQASSNSIDSQLSLHNGQSPLDLQVLATIRQMGGEQADLVLSNIIKSFLENTPQRLQAITTAVDNCNCDAVRQLAHNLKSSSANLGAINFSGLCKQLESDCRSGTISGAAQYLSKLKAEYVLVEQALNREYQNMCAQLTG